MGKRTESTKGDWCHSDVGEEGTVREGSAVGFVCRYIKGEASKCYGLSLKSPDRLILKHGTVVVILQRDDSVKLKKSSSIMEMLEMPVAIGVMKSEKYIGVPWQTNCICWH